MCRPVYRYICSLSIVKCTMLLLYIEISKEISEETGCSNVSLLKRHNGLLGYKTSQFFEDKYKFKLFEKDSLK